MQEKVPDNQHVFRFASWIWLIYLVTLVLVNVIIYHPQPLFSPILYNQLISGLPALLFLVLAYIGWTEKNSKFLVPVMILLITVAPILMNYLFNLRLPPAPLSNLEGMVLRQLPILLIGLVLVAWHYNLWIMVSYSFLTNLAELWIVSFFGLMVSDRLNSFAFIILIRTVSFIVVGVFVHLLIIRLRRQQESLINANVQLTHFAHTLENLTISRERNRMSRELHDTVVHTLSGLSVQLETAKAYWDVDPTTARSLLDASLEITRSGLQETRRAIKSLRASSLDDLGLIRALRLLLDDASQRGQLIVDTHLPPDDTVFAPDVEQCIYRIAQEALENVIRHAKANHLMIRLNADECGIELLIQDDGLGFDSQAGLPAGHFGLAGMRERADLAGGRLTVESHPNGGTMIRLILKGSTI